METSASFDARSAPSSYPTATQSGACGILFVEHSRGGLGGSVPALSLFAFFLIIIKKTLARDAFDLSPSNEDALWAENGSPWGLSQRSEQESR